MSDDPKRPDDRTQARLRREYELKQADIEANKTQILKDNGLQLVSDFRARGVLEDGKEIGFAVEIFAENAAKDGFKSPQIDLLKPHERHDRLAKAEAQAQQIEHEAGTVENAPTEAQKNHETELPNREAEFRAAADEITKRSDRPPHHDDPGSHPHDNGPNRTPPNGSSSMEARESTEGDMTPARAALYERLRGNTENDGRVDRDQTPNRYASLNQTHEQIAETSKPLDRSEREAKESDFRDAGNEMTDRRAALYARLRCESDHGGVERKSGNDRPGHPPGRDPGNSSRSL